MTFYLFGFDHYKYDHFLKSLSKSGQYYIHRTGSRLVTVCVDNKSLVFTIGIDTIGVHMNDYSTYGTKAKTLNNKELSKVLLMNLSQQFEYFYRLSLCQS